jgi:hypothetical protein
MGLRNVSNAALRASDIQFRFKRSPRLIDGPEPRDVIRENNRLTTAALKTRIGVDPAGFRRKRKESGVF